MQGRRAGAGPDTVNRSVLAAAIRLAAIAVLTSTAGCSLLNRGGRGEGRNTTRSAPGQPQPGAVAVTPPKDSAGQAPIPRADSTPRTPPLRTDAPARPGIDSAHRADSIARATAEAVRAQSVRDSIARSDSLARVAAAKKKAKPATRPCVLDFADSPPETRLLYSRVTDSISNTFIGGGFVGRCQGENNRIRADSAEQFQAPGIVNLYGNVTYEEPGKVQIIASHATYFTREGRLYADGNVTATQIGTGSSFSGPTMEYYRAMPDRPVSRMIASSRSTARVIEKDSLGRLGPPTIIVANRFEDAGDSLLMAWGDVTIDRDQISGRADSSSFDKVAEKARLVRSARITNRDTTQRFVLVGDTIDLFGANRELDRVVAMHKATATSEDMVLESERIDLRLEKQLLKEAFAYGTGRSKAHTPQQDVEADSLRILLSGKSVAEMHAVGGALAIGTPDTLRIKTAEKDVLRGDRVVAYFDSTTGSTARPGADSVRRTRIREIRALGNASSLFHMANDKGRTAAPGINYVRGARIFVTFDTGAVRVVRVDSAASGLYLEPEPDSLSDSTRKAPASGRRPGAPVDTAAKTPPRQPLQGPGKREPSDAPGVTVVSRPRLSQRLTDPKHFP